MNRRLRSRVFFLAVALFLVITTAGAESTWQLTLSLREAGLNESGAELVFGVDPAGTDRIDRHLGVVELPPPAPGLNFDARFRSATMGEGSRTDIRFGGSPQQEHVSIIEFKRQAGGNVVFTWDEAAVAARTVSAVLRDPFDGMFYQVDMRQEGSLTVEYSALERLELVFTSVDGFDLEGTPVTATSWGRVKAAR